MPHRDVFLSKVVVGRPRSRRGVQDREEYRSARVDPQAAPHALEGGLREARSRGYEEGVRGGGGGREGRLNRMTLRCTLTVIKDMWINDEIYQLKYIISIIIQHCHSRSVSFSTQAGRPSTLPPGAAVAPKGDAVIHEASLCRERPDDEFVNPQLRPPLTRYVSIFVTQIGIWYVMPRSHYGGEG